MEWTDRKQRKKGSWRALESRRLNCTLGDGWGRTGVVYRPVSAMGLETKKGPTNGDFQEKRDGWWGWDRRPSPVGVLVGIERTSECCRSHGKTRVLEWAQNNGVGEGGTDVERLLSGPILSPFGTEGRRRLH